MLEEAIYKFKVSGPTIMPSLFDNFFLKETEECNGYCITPIRIQQPSRLSSDNVHVPISCRKSNVTSR